MYVTFSESAHVPDFRTWHIGMSLFGLVPYLFTFFQFMQPKYYCKCSIIKSWLIGDMVTFLHTLKLQPGWYSTQRLAFMFVSFSSSSLSLLLKKITYVLFHSRPWIYKKESILCLNISAADKHLYMYVIPDKKDVSLCTFPQTLVHFCLAVIALYVFCGCVNHTSTDRSIQFLMGPPGLHSSSLLIFSCFPFLHSQGMGCLNWSWLWRRMWGIEKQIEDMGKSKLREEHIEEGKQH